ncbi:uncharacterized protein LOC132174196 [Corylus avellana]|uniref:uncharacterized protein LOC132174196 n=1 Tax=Corylus avellana TaxID=13451 RepID=UPI00286BA5B6|nr:uncharacterized protein LOC132174196 [Corylus avellana]
MEKLAFALTIASRKLRSYFQAHTIRVLTEYPLKKHAFVTDNGKQFDCESFREWCAKVNIRNYYSSPAHRQTNGQVEATNKTIFKVLKMKLGNRKGDWADDLPEVLWAYRTMKRTPTEETPYTLAFRTEAVIPAEVGLGSYRVETFHPKTNDEGLKLHLDL